jgi:glycine cleavage system T protein
MPELTPLHDLTRQAGAVFAEQANWQIPAHYGDAAGEYYSAREHAALFDLSHRGKIEVIGRDAVTFLNNLSTNDIKSLPVGAGCEAFLCTAKAKVVSQVLVYRLPPEDQRPGFALHVAPGMAEKTIQHLDHYLISEDVELADRTRAFAEVHLCGPQATMILTRALREPLSELQEHQHLMQTFGAASLHIRRHSPLGLLAYDLVCPAEHAAEVWQALSDAGARPAGLETYEVLRVEAGMPVYGVDIDENRLVFEVGRTAQAISYTKGCYLGQEPVVMARDRGHANRTLLGLKILEGGAVPPGSRVLHGGEEVGQVTSSAVSPQLGVAIALAYLRRGHQEPGTAVEVETEGGRRKAEVALLPFVS